MSAFSSSRYFEHFARVCPLGVPQHRRTSTTPGKAGRSEQDEIGLFSKPRDRGGRHHSCRRLPRTGPASRRGACPNPPLSSRPPAAHCPVLECHFIEIDCNCATTRSVNQADKVGFSHCGSIRPVEMLSPLMPNRWACRLSAWAGQTGVEVLSDERASRVGDR